MDRNHLPTLFWGLLRRKDREKKGQKPFTDTLLRTVEKKGQKPFTNTLLRTVEKKGQKPFADTKDCWEERTEAIYWHSVKDCWKERTEAIYRHWEQIEGLPRPDRGLPRSLPSRTAHRPRPGQGHPGLQRPAWSWFPGSTEAHEKGWVHWSWWRWRCSAVQVRGLPPQGQPVGYSGTASHAIPCSLEDKGASASANKTQELGLPLYKA